MMASYQAVVEGVAEAVVTAGSTFTPDKIRAYERALEAETNPNGLAGRSNS